MAAGGAGSEVTQALYLPAPARARTRTSLPRLLGRTIFVSLLAMLWPSMLLPLLASAPEAVQAFAESVSPALLP